MDINNKPKSNTNSLNQDLIRNIAIIAHVDHGKTTLVDAFLKQTHLFRENQEEMQQERILDSNELEREKGITIKAKNISVRYKGHKINIIDTPGHADFGGEVERILNMADGCLLIIDAQEGPMPQTRFVLKKALELKLPCIAVINKIDKKLANPAHVLEKLQDLFLSLATDVGQLDFPVYYAIGREGKVYSSLPEGDLTVPNSIAGTTIPLLEAIVDYLPAPKGEINGPFQMQISSLEYDDHQGRRLVGKINRGTIRSNTQAIVLHSPESDSKKEIGYIRKIYMREGLDFIEVDSARAGEIVALSGIDSTAIGGTICEINHPEALPVIKISNPSVQVKFAANSSPFVGREGKFVTSRLLQQRLDREIENNISLKITKGDAGAYYVAGRGELQLSILIETLRREGFEFEVSRPEVLLIRENGVRKEPIEDVFISVPEEFQGAVTTTLSARKAELIDMEIESCQVKFTYKILTRSLIGLRNELLTLTKGNLAINNYLVGYVPYTNQSELFRKGVLIASETGESIGYALNTVQERGIMFISPGVKVYEGMIVGINKYDQDMVVNVIRGRKKSAVRMKHDEITQTTLKPIIPLTIDFALTFMAKDELLEVTPQNLRLRKKHLTKNDRSFAKRKEREKLNLK